MKIFKVFDKSVVDKINEIIDDLEWQDGRDTAMGAAKEIKRNFQIMPSNVGWKRLQPFVNAAHSVNSVQNFTFATNIISPRVASYSGGGYYDWHSDAALMAGNRADLSFSIFLRDPETYTGGELEIQLQAGVIKKFKCEAGDMVVYPSALLHKVHPVTAGERRVMVGWVKSNVKDHAQREILHDLRLEIMKMKEACGADMVKNLTQVYQRLVREFSS